MKVNSKKGFTLVELVIVIAVIGILAAVLIPTFVDLVKKANVSNDTILVKNLNTALVAESVASTPVTPTDVMEMMEKNGFTVSKMTPRSTGEIVWDSEANRFALVEWDATAEKFNVVYAESDRITNKVNKLWVLISSLNQGQAYIHNGYSVYLKPNFVSGDITVKAGVDVGDNANINVNYDRSSTEAQAQQTQTDIIRTQGDQTVITINAPTDNVNFYGFAQKIDVAAIKNTSLHIYGSTNELAVTSGHVAVENTGIVFEVVSLATATGSITNSGYIAAAAPSVDPEVASEIVNTGAYEINSLARLEAFRDAVNAGNAFEGREVKLTADITLNDGWKPIGEGNRDVAATNIAATGLTTYFVGTFNGDNHIISNLNNKGFVPSERRIVNDTERQYAYGLFALVGDGATIKNLTLNNVNIDTTTYTSANGDSVAALVGYANGSVNIENIVVKGTIKASDAVAGVIGRVYAQRADISSYQVNISNCENKATVIATAEGGKAAGIIAILSDRKATRTMELNVLSCTNSGNISSLNTTESYSAGIFAYATKYNKNATTGSVYTLTSCTNTGVITNAGTNAKSAFGPIIGHDDGVVIE